MSRARLFRAALAAALGLACGCSTTSSCSSCPGSSLTSRLTSLFRRDRAGGHEIDCCPGEGPVVVDPGAVPGPGFGGPSAPQTFPPPLAAPRPLPPGEAPPMPYQP